MGLDPYHIVSVEDIAPPEQEGTVVLTSVEKLFTQYLDLFGKPTREFLKKLAPFAYDIQDKVAIAEMTLDRKTEDFQNKQAQAYTYAEYLTEFKSLRIPADKYTVLIPTVKQRVYSICSSSDFRPGKCQLLVVREDWEAKGGDTKFGLCSSFLTFLKPGAYCLGHSTHSVMKIPDDKNVHIFMAGLGTGLAPFRAFVEQRKCEKNQGIVVGLVTLLVQSAFYKVKDMPDVEKALKGILVISTVLLTPMVLTLSTWRLPEEIRCQACPQVARFIGSPAEGATVG